MSTKLIIVDGASTVGKSSVSKAVYNIINQNKDAVWLHEECKNHPIRANEFNCGDLTSKEGMQSNLTDMLTKWRNLVSNIIENHNIYIMEGCLLHQLDRYLLQSIWSINEIRKYYTLVIEILKPLNPIVIFLYRPNIKNSFLKAFEDRGEWWKQIILEKPDPVGFFKHNEYIDDESIYKALSYEQNQMKLVFDKLECKKIELNTTDEKWRDYVHDILKYCGFPIIKNDLIELKDDKYCGKYKQKDDDNTWVIGWDNNREQYYSSLFWPY